MPETPAGEPSDDSRRRRRSAEVLPRAGLRHDSRHGLGMLAVQAFPLSDVEANMGHAHIATTMIYVHFVPEVDAAIGCRRS